jgi:hypothetical protein
MEKCVAGMCARCIEGLAGAPKSVRTLCSVYPLVWRVEPHGGGSPEEAHR